jgi:hypothetical protein
MKLALGFILLCLLTACATKPNEALPDPTETKADTKARDEFARTLPKPPDR